MIDGTALQDARALTGDLASQSNSVNNYGTARDIHSGNIINIHGVSLEQLISTLREHGGLAGIDRETVTTLALRLRPHDCLNFDQALRELEGAIDVAREVMACNETIASQTDIVTRTLVQIGHLTSESDLDGAAQMLDHAIAALKPDQCHGQVTLQEAGVKLDTLRRLPSDVAHRIAQIVALQNPGGRPTWHPAYRKRYSVFNSDGDLRGLNVSAQIASEMALLMLDTADTDSEIALAHNLTANAILPLGRRGIGKNSLAIAADLWRDAVRLQSRTAAPLEWAKYQSNLGNALVAMAEREAGTAKFVEAVGAYEAALEERTRERVPVEWAKTQLNLGSALRQIGDRLNKISVLERAASAFRLALEELVRDEFPDQWSTAQSQLGVTLLCIGQRESGTPMLKDAIAAFETALKVRTRESSPQRWANTKNCLATALRELGWRTDQRDLVERAVLTYHDVLDVWTDTGAPDLWAGVQVNLSHTLRELAEHEMGTTRLEEAATIDRSVLAVLTPNRHKHLWAMAHNGLGLALLEVGKREGDTAQFDYAARSFRHAMSIWTAKDDPACYGQARNGFREAQALLRDHKQAI